MCFAGGSKIGTEKQLKRDAGEVRGYIITVI